jgi:hypothetical protein
MRVVLEADGEATIGRESVNIVHLPHPRVSRAHARLDSSPDGALEVIDLKSRNGTVVNGQPVYGSAIVPFPALVEIGPFLLAIDTRMDDETWVELGPSSDRRLRSRLDRGTRQFYVDGVMALDTLSSNEFGLLESLAESAPSVVARTTVGDAIWGIGQWDVYMLHNLVSRIRKRISQAGSDGSVIVTVPGIGYRLA